jgi:hypothetical protein
MIGSLDNFRLGMGLSAVPFQKLPSKNANLDGLDGFGSFFTTKNIVIVVVLALLVKNIYN